MMVLHVLLGILGLIAVASGQSCVAPFVPLAGKCFYLETSEQGSSFTWQEARDYCQALGGDLNADLASFPSCDEFTDYSRYMAFNSPGNMSLWVGVHSLFSPNMWQWVTLESLQTGVPFWYYGATFNSGYACASSESSYYYKLLPNDCQDTKPFACSYTPVIATVEKPAKRAPINCPNGGVVIGDFCYFFMSKAENFEAADAQCRVDHGEYGGTLYYPSSCEEFSRIAHHLETTGDLNKYWIGAIDVSGQGEWTWVSGQGLAGGPPYWASGEPSHEHDNQPREHCGTISIDQRFYVIDEHCSDSNHYFCKLFLA